MRLSTRSGNTAPSHKAIVWVVHLLVFTSGAAALIYEVLWTRLFVSLFGATAPAISATLAAMFLGLAAGSWAIGKRSSRWRRPLRAYGILEIAIGLSAIIVIPFIGLYEQLYSVIYPWFAGYPSAFVITRSALAVVALFAPAFLMGGTLPLIVEALGDSRAKLGLIGSSIYAANIFGATIGALSVPFIMLPTLGASWSYIVAVQLNLSIGAVAILLDRSSLPETLGAPTDREERAPTTTVAERMSQPALIIFCFLSGALVLALEVLWTRMLAQVHENSIYSFATVLAVFLVGLAAGASIARILLARSVEHRRLLGFAWLCAGVLVFCSPQIFYFLTGGLSYIDDSGQVAKLLGLAVASMLAPTVLAGMVLPLLMEISAASGGGPAGSMLGKLLAVNTLGAIIGPMVATYVVSATIGLWMGLALIGVLMIASGEIALNRRTGRKAGMVRRFALVVGLVVVFLAQSPITLPRARVKREGNEELIHLREGSHGIVAVLEADGDRWMLLNNFYTLGGTASAIEERQQARIPIFLHPAPRKVAFLGLGTGITAGAAQLPTVERVVALELVPEVTASAKDYFAEANLGLLRNAKVDIVNEDARTYLKASGEKFDVIVGDLVVPWRSGESFLFTREHFAAARAALARDGLFCQWLPMYQLSDEQFRIIAATFLDVFPNTTLWRGDFFTDTPALALIGHTNTEPLDVESIDRTIAGLKPSTRMTSPMLSETGGLWLFFVGPLDPAEPQFRNSRINSEDKPWIELLTPGNRSDSRNGSSMAFTGRSLFDFMERVRSPPLAGVPFRKLSSEHLKWRDAGAALWEASLLLDEGDEEKANKRAEQSLALLPSELRNVIGGANRER